jgi:hypothetical protein
VALTGLCSLTVLEAILGRQLYSRKEKWQFNGIRNLAQPNDAEATITALEAANFTDADVSLLTAPKHRKPESRYSTHNQGPRSHSKRRRQEERY